MQNRLSRQWVCLSQQDLDDACVYALRQYADAVETVGDKQRPTFDTGLDYVVDRPELIPMAAYDLVTAYVRHAGIDGDDEGISTDTSDVCSELNAAWNAKLRPVPERRTYSPLNPDDVEQLAAEVEASSIDELNALVATQGENGEASRARRRLILDGIHEFALGEHEQIVREDTDLNGWVAIANRQIRTAAARTSLANELAELHEVALAHHLTVASDEDLTATWKAVTGHYPALAEAIELELIERRRTRVENHVRYLVPVPEDLPHATTWSSVQMRCCCGRDHSCHAWPTAAAATAVMTDSELERMADPRRGGVNRLSITAARGEQDRRADLAGQCPRAS